MCGICCLQNSKRFPVCGSFFMVRVKDVIICILLQKLFMWLCQILVAACIFAASGRSCIMVQGISSCGAQGLEHEAHRSFVPKPGIEPVPCTARQILNDKTTREVPVFYL